MALFHQIPNAVGVFTSRGIYKQVDLFKRNGFIYAKWGSGFIGLRRQNGTTIPNVSIVELEGITPYYNDLGQMIERPSVRSVA